MVVEIDVLNSKGEFVGEVKTRKEIHEAGLWHRISYGFIFDGSNNVLLQKRANSKISAGKWDKTIGGHVETGESCYRTLLRKAKEEIGIVLDPSEIEHFGCAISDFSEGAINCHIFVEGYIIRKNINIDSLKINKNEIEELKWFKKEEILEMIKNKDKSLIGKDFLWNFLTQMYKTL